jgi:lipoprotein-anchoring transpeptidase ErfK/SrfK
MKNFGKLLSLGLLIVASACGQQQNTSDNVSETQAVTAATHTVCASDVNVRNAGLGTILFTAKLNEKVAVTGATANGMGHTFKEVKMVERGDSRGWIAQQFLCAAGTSGGTSGAAKIVVNLTTNRLKFFKGGTLVREWNVASARPGKTTPTGNFRVTIKDPCPPYFGAAGDKNVGNCNPNKPISASNPINKDNPLGAYALWFNDSRNSLPATMFGLHGTNQPALIAEGTTASQRYLSAGCVRNHNDNILWLSTQVTVGTPIEIIR